MSAVDPSKAVALQLAGDEVSGWCRGQWDPAPPACVDAVSNDSRTIRAGSLYVAIEGERFDGHTFVRKAQEAGACGAIVKRDWVRDVAPGFPLLRVASPEQALREVASGYRLRVAPRCIGITGSAGKTTVKELTAQTVSASFRTARSVGNWNNQIGLPLSLLAMDPGTQVGVFELGTNHPGEIASLAAVLRPDWGIVTNIGAGHIEFFHSVQAIAEEKSALLQALPADGVAFLNCDGPWFELLRARTPCTVVTVSTCGPADYWLRERSPSNEALVVEERASGETFRFGLAVGGEAQAANALVAVAVARRLGLGRGVIEAALARRTEMSMRWQRSEVAGVQVINDAYNANPLSMRAALSAFAEERVVGRKWLVLGGMRELGAQAEAEHVALGRDVAAGPWAGVVAVGDLGRMIARGAEEAGFAVGNLHVCAGADEAARLIAASVLAGDGVLLKASRGERLEDVLKHWQAVRGAPAA